MNHYHSHSHPNEVDLDLRLQQSTVPVRSFSQPQIHQLPPHYYDSPELSRAKLPSPPHWQSPESKSIPLLSTVSSNGMRAGPNVLPSLINLKEYGSYEEDRR